MEYTDTELIDALGNKLTAEIIYDNKRRQRAVVLYTEDCANGAAYQSTIRQAIIYWIEQGEK